MKQAVYFILFVALFLPMGGCKKYLNINPQTDLSGNNFWQTKADAQNFTNGMYELFRKSVSRLDMKAAPGETGNEFSFLPFAGDLRAAPVFEGNGQAFGRYYIQDLSTNNITHLLTPNSDGNAWYYLFNLKRFTQWDRFFQVIASANIAYVKMDGVPDPALGADLKRTYKAEAVFLRCLCYFLMVRQFGDVPYYTNAYNTAPLKRLAMVQVLKNCIADLTPVKNDLPWTYTDPVFVAVRAMRGSALALLMHMNMWLAAFDTGNQNAYYTAVDQLGDELQNENGGAYQLLPIEKSGEIFKGRSKEGLFEIPQNANYGESFAWSTFYDLVSYNLPGTGTRVSQVYYSQDFMKKLYPVGQADKRADLWFDRTTLYSYQANPDLFRMRKFLISSDPSSVDGFGFDASQILFRLGGEILLQSEALAELGNDDKARVMVNKIRTRAGAPPLTLSGDDLKSEIFFERCRELQGEGHYYYDVVRTKRITDISYKFGYHMTMEQYKAGAWQWPIDPAAQINNPEITLNSYWQ